MLRWYYLLQSRLLASEAADNTVDIFVTHFGYVDHATSRWITPTLNIEMRQIIPKRRLVGFDVPALAFKRPSW